MNLDWPISSSSDYLATHTLDRAYLTVFLKNLTLSVGRQRIAWGVARFISPTDLFNPFDLTTIDKEERRGTDAVLAEISMGQFTGLSLVFAPTTNMDRASYAFRFYTNIADYDVSVMAGRFRDKEVYGFDFSGQIKEVAIWGECAAYFEDHTDQYLVPDPSSFFGFSMRESRREFVRAAVGAQYIFPNTFSILAEYYYNGKGETDKANYNVQAELNGQELTLAQHYLFVTLSYEFTPLLNGSFSTFCNINDGSVLFFPYLEYSITENFYADLGAEIGVGDAQTEYGTRPKLYYLELRYYF